MLCYEKKLKYIFSKKYKFRLIIRLLNYKYPMYLKFGIHYDLVVSKYEKLCYWNIICDNIMKLKLIYIYIYIYIYNYLKKVS